MTNEEKKSALPTVPEGAEFSVREVTNLNFRPHPYTIGPRHVAWASDHFCGRLGVDAIEDAERHGVRCAARRCNLKYEEHTSDVVCLIETASRYTSPIDVPGLIEYLKTVAPIAESLKIDGFAFVKAANSPEPQSREAAAL